MILFVFEGGKAEPKIFSSIQKLFFKDEEVKVICCKYDLPTLYKKLKENDYDLFSFLPLEEQMDISKGCRVDTLFSQIFLFFDYDFQNRMGLEKLNKIMIDMLEFFNNETENGKLYINYPMVESLKYTKELPDSNYFQYTASYESCCNHEFKTLAENFAYSKAKNYRFIDIFKIGENDAKANWNLLKNQNVNKANYIVANQNEKPNEANEIQQLKIFDSQISKYVQNNRVSILNAFPLFLYEYFGI